MIMHSLVESCSVVHVIIFLVIYLPSELSIYIDMWRSLAILYTVVFQNTKFCTSKARLHGKTVIITGASRGMGKEIALDLAKRGAKVILACITLKESEETANDLRKRLCDLNCTGDIVARELDLSSFNSIRKCARQILDDEKEINILINNAATVKEEKCLTEDGMDFVFGVNYLGHFLLTCLLLPRLISSSPSRIINVSSVSHLSATINLDDLNFERTHYNVFFSYASSKLALILFTRELSKKLKGTGVTVYAVNPGQAGTHLWKQFFTEICHPIIWPLYKKIFFPILKTPFEGAQTTIYCAVDDNVANESGYYYSECKKKSPSRIAMDRGIAEILWIESEKLVGLENSPILKDLIKN